MNPLSLPATLHANPNRRQFHARTDHHEMMMPHPLTPEQAAEHIAEQFAEAVAVRVAGTTHQRLGAWAKALACFAVAREIFTELGNQAQVGWTLYHEANVLDLLGRPSEAITCFNQAEQVLRTSSESQAWPLLSRCRDDFLRLHQSAPTRP